MTLRIDRAPITAKVTPEGYIEDSPILTRSGIFLYRNADGSLRKEYRPPEEVFKKPHLDSMKGQPVVDGHPGVVNSMNVKKHIVGTCLSEGRQDAEGARADVIIYDSTPIKQGRKELSLGYEVDLIEQPGEIDGERYDAIQTNMRVNHIALVERGRAGNARLNLDAAEAVLIEESITMTDKTVTVRLDSGLSYEAAPEVAHELDKLRKDAKEAGDQVVSATKERDTEKARADALCVELKQLKGAQDKIKLDARDAAIQRVQLEATASDIGVEFNADQSDVDIQKSIANKVYGDKIKFDGKSDEYIKGIFDMAIAERKNRSDAVAAQRVAVTITNKEDVAVSAKDARKAYINQMTGKEAK